MRSWPDTSTLEQQWQSSPRPFDFESSTVSTRPHAAILLMNSHSIQHVQAMQYIYIPWILPHSALHLPIPVRKVSMQAHLRSTLGTLMPSHKSLVSLKRGNAALNWQSVFACEKGRFNPLPHYPRPLCVAHIFLPFIKTVNTSLCW